MPTTYTHDLFGKKVYRLLPEELQKVIRENKDLYRIGLHGPDILFYHLFRKDVFHFGIAMHHERACDFFEQGMSQVRRRRDPALLAYLLGFGCHYVLDLFCHPYINQMADQGKITHTLLEKETDRVLMRESGKNPYAYYPSCGIVVKPVYVQVIHQVFPLIQPKTIETSMKMMKRLTNAMVCDDGGRRRERIKILTGILGKTKQAAILDYFMTSNPNPAAGPYVEEVIQLFEQALGKAPEYLNELYALSLEEGVLSSRWFHTFAG